MQLLLIPLQLYNRRGDLDQVDSRSVARDQQPLLASPAGDR